MSEMVDAPAESDAADDMERIWLSPREFYDDERTWCADNVWGEDSVEYVRADVALAALDNARQDAALAMRKAAFQTAYAYAVDHSSDYIAPAVAWNTANEIADAIRAIPLDHPRGPASPPAGSPPAGSHARGSAGALSDDGDVA